MLGMQVGQRPLIHVTGLHVGTQGTVVLATVQCHRKEQRVLRLPEGGMLQQDECPVMVVQCSCIGPRQVIVLS